MSAGASTLNRDPGTSRAASNSNADEGFSRAVRIRMLWCRSSSTPRSTCSQRRQSRAPRPGNSGRRKASSSLARPAALRSAPRPPASRSSGTSRSTSANIRPRAFGVPASRYAQPFKRNERNVGQSDSAQAIRSSSQCADRARRSAPARCATGPRPPRATQSSDPASAADRRRRPATAPAATPQRQVEIAGRHRQQAWTDQQRPQAAAARLARAFGVTQHRHPPGAINAATASSRSEYTSRKHAAPCDHVPHGLETRLASFS